MHSAMDGAQRPRSTRGGKGRASTALRVVAIWAFEGYSRSISAFDSLQGFVERRRRLFVLTGAGCSTNSGIPDYRDADGNWKRQQPVTCLAFIGPGDAPALLGAEYGWLAPFLSGRPQRCHARRDWVHSTSRITLRRFIRSRACTTSFLSSTARRCSTVRAASRGPGSMYSPRMRLASSTARISVS
jgi:hypothetical protein